MKKGISLPIILLAIATILIAFSYYDSYPVTLDDAGKTIFNINPLLWVGLGIAFGCILWLSHYSSNKFFLLFLSVMFVFLFTAPSFFYYIEGSDTAGGFGGLVEYTYQNGIPDASVRTYFQWPVTFNYISFLHDLTGLPSNVTLKLTMVSLILVFASNLFLFFMKNGSPKPAMNIILYFIAFYLFINWQVAPQLFGFTLFIVLLNLIKVDIRYKMLVVIAFTALVFTHAFTSFWFLGILLISGIITLILGLRNRQFHLEKYKNLLPLLLSIQVFALLIFMKNYFFSLESLLKGLMASSSQTETSTAIFFDVQNSLLAQYSGLFEILTQRIGQIILVFTMVVVLISFLIAMKQRNLSVMEIGIILTGVIHFGVGSIISVLGGRGLQVTAIAVTGKHSPALFKNYAQIIVAVLLVICILFPTTLIRYQDANTHYTTEIDRSGLSFILDTSPTTDKSWILTNGIDGGFLTSFSDNLLSLNPRDYVNQNITSNRMDYILYNQKFNAELKSFAQPEQIEEKSITNNPDFLKIYQNPEQTFYTYYLT